jgi:osmoprotectant transport system ATP-binding protein
MQKTGVAVAFEHVTWKYPKSDIAALADIHFRVEKGETLVLLGPSGCGKSSLLKTVNRLFVPQSGVVTVDGADIADVDVIALRRRIGYVIQSVGLFPHRTVAQNIATVPELLGWDKPRIADRVDQMLQLVRLDPEDYRNRRPSALSGGEAQRIGIARAIAAYPQLLLMDEPFGALDPVVRASLQREVATIVRDLGTTTLFVTHDIEEALMLADRIVVMQAGRVVQIAQPLQLLQEPATAAVADLIGSENILRRLRLIRVEQAMERGRFDDHATGQARLSINDDLFTALQMLFAQPEGDGIAVFDGELCVGRLRFAQLAHALYRHNVAYA